MWVSQILKRSQRLQIGLYFVWWGVHYMVLQHVNRNIVIWKLVECLSILRFMTFFHWLFNGVVENRWVFFSI